MNLIAPAPYRHSTSAVHRTYQFCRPDDHFDIPWRREMGAGQVILNLIHGLPCNLCGGVVSVQAMESNSPRGKVKHPAATEGTVDAV
jgi:hypothetical protein